MTSHAPSRPPGFAEAVPAGRFVHLSGAIAQDAAGAVTGDVRQQTQRALEALRAAARRAGTDLDRAAKVNVFLRHATDFGAMNEAYAGFFQKDPPARTTVVAGLREPGALVEIAAVLVADGQPREVVHPRDWKRSPNPYSYGIRSGDTLFLAGLVARRGRDNSAVAGDMATQTRAVLDNARELLEAGGMSFADVVSSRVYVTGAAEFRAMNDAYREAFPADYPARATVVTALMSPELIVEITLIAVRDAKRRTIGDAGAIPISPAVHAGGRLFLSGVLGNTPETRDNVRAQTVEMLSRIGATLQAGGHGWADVREAVLYVTEMSTRDVVLAELAKVMSGGLPAGVIVQTGLVVPDGLVELMVTAARD